MAKTDYTPLVLGGLGIAALYILRKPLQQTGEGIADVTGGIGSAFTGVGGGISRVATGISEPFYQSSENLRQISELKRQLREAQYQETEEEKVQQADIAAKGDVEREVIKQQSKTIRTQERENIRVGLSKVPSKTISAIKGAVSKVPTPKLFSIAPITAAKVSVAKTVVKAARSVGKTIRGWFN